MSRCEHKNTEYTADGKRLYCVDCGMRMITPPDAVYYRALQDSRRLKWRKVGEAGYVVELSKTYIGAWWEEAMRCWTYRRVRWSEDLSAFEIVQEGADERGAAGLPVSPLYIAHDELGTPADPPVGKPTLSSVA